MWMINLHTKIVLFGVILTKSCSKYRLLFIIYPAEMVNKIRSVTDRNNKGSFEIRMQYFIHKEEEEQMFNMQKVKE